MEQTEIDETITALQNRVSDEVMAQVIQVVDQQIVPLKWTTPESQPATADNDTSRRSIQVPVQSQLRVPVSPRSENPTAESTSQLERVLEQGNMSEHQQIAQIQVIKPTAHRDNPMHLPETTAETPMVDEFPTPEGGWVSIDISNVQRLRTTGQGDPPPEIVQESILTEPLQRTIPLGLRPDHATRFANADELIAAYEKRPRVFPTRPMQGPALAPTTVSLTTPYSFSEWNPEQYGSLPSDLAIQQGEMLQMMWNHTRNQAARVDSIEQILANQYQILPERRQSRCSPTAPH
eukprot:4711123-Amphidinium_carterae.1